MGYLILILWLTILPLCAGGCLYTKQNRISPGGQWLWGQFALWALFQVVAVYYILQKGDLSQVLDLYVPICGVLGVTGLACRIFMWTKEHKSFHRERSPWTKEQKFLAVAFGLLWILQMLAIVFLAVNDGDDAYYMAVANVAESSGSLYTTNVYSFGNTELTYRYALAPFPIWIAALSRISGVHTLIIGHVVLGIVLVSMSYVIYAQIGWELFGDNRQKMLLLLVFVAILYMWGNTSSHTAESFLLLRSRQGKALVAGIVFPAMIYLIVRMGHRLEQRQKLSWAHYVMAAVVILGGCLGSTLGGSLVILLWGSAVLLLAICYKRPWIVPAGVLSAIPGALYALLYLTN